MPGLGGLQLFIGHTTDFHNLIHADIHLTSHRHFLTEVGKYQANIIYDSPCSVLELTTNITTVSCIIIMESTTLRQIANCQSGRLGLISQCCECGKLLIVDR